MSFLMRGRSPWWWNDQSRPREAQRAPETVTAATGPPVAAPTPQGGTDALRPGATIDDLRTIALARASGLRVEPVIREVLGDGSPEDRQWVAGELRRLEKLATLTRQHGPWAAAQHMYGGTR